MSDSTSTDAKVLVLYQQEDLHPQRMFKAVKTRIHVVESDFHAKPVNGQMMPKQHHVNRIADAAGITFETVDKVLGETSWTVTVRAFKRGPDGTPRHGDGSYSYDWVERAKDGGKRVALQRAETGARLRSIRAVVGVPTAFDRDNFDRAIEVCRIVVDTDALLEDPDMREAAINHALGAEKSLYGPRERDVSPEPAQIEAPEEAGPDDEWPDEEPVIGEEKQHKWQAIQEYASAYNLPDKATAKIAALEPLLATADIASFDDLLARLKSWTEKNPGAQR